MFKVFKKDIFISHSSNNAIVAEQLGALLKNLGVSNDRIFCSSVLGQGINNGEKLNDAILKAIKNAKMIIYILSQDFLASEYCIEELGVGWYQSSTKRAHCYFLRLPDIELSELCGFVNSKIDKFSLLSSTDDLTLFVENICNSLKISIPRPSEISCNIRSFLSAINEECSKCIEKKTEAEKLENERLQKVEILELELEYKGKLINDYRNRMQLEKERNDSEKLKAELNVICRYMHVLGGGNVISSSTIKSVYKDFWFKIITRYKEILSKDIQPASYDMERLIAQIYIAYGDYTNGYIHFKYAIENAFEYVVFYNIENFVDEYPFSLSEIIELLKELMQKDRDGVGKDMTADCIRRLEEREGRIAVTA